MARTRVVIEGSTVSASQLKDLFRMIDDGTVDGNRLQRFMQDPSWGGNEAEVTLSSRTATASTSAISFAYPHPLDTPYAVHLESCYCS